MPYDFYNHPPDTIDDVKDYLTSWLTKIIVDEDVPPVDHPCGTEWYLTYEFRRAFNLHQVYTCEGDTPRFAFHVSEDGWDGETLPNMGVYESWDEMIDGVALKYAVAWKLPS